jgi:hypothetical protein
MAACMKEYELDKSTGEVIFKIDQEPQYFYVWKNHKGEVRFLNGLNELPIEYKYIGKIQLETDNDVEL